jgi:hypothetical protein
VGRAVVGRAVVGRAVVGRAVVGRAVVGRAVVGRAGLEPATPCVSCKCATRLRQRPPRVQPYHPPPST